ncbi:MAG: tRNA (adenosine(37)-N6)-dimethylallyltransferase MiaA [Gammaproteobacteria bacterium]
MLNALAIAGPTASGKSEMAYQVAEDIGGEVISVDAGGVYREMDIGAAKPPKQWRRRVRHHLFDIRNPNESFDAGAFCRLAVAAATDIAARGKKPILAGGTMMYFYALHRRMHNIPPVPAAVRAQVEEEIKAKGAAAMHNALTKADSESAQHIQKGDSQRICRALSVLRASGKRLSEWQKAARPPPLLRMQTALFIPADRALLRRHIGKRLRRMFADGLAEETQAVMQKWQLQPNAQSLRLAGYRQAADFASGKMTEEEMHERAYFATCQLAKRQLARLRAWQNPNIVLDPFAADARGRLLAFADNNQK